MPRRNGRCMFGMRSVVIMRSRAWQYEPTTNDPLMQEPAQAPPRVFNRLRAVLLHVPYFTIQGFARLAEDTSFSRSTICRIAQGSANPSYRTAEAIAWAISKRCGILLSPREIFSTDGTFPTSSTCQLMNCSGCLPPEAWDEETDTIRPEWRDKKPGEWSRVAADPASPGNTQLTSIS